MRPRQEITALDTEASIAECLEAPKRQGIRLPTLRKGDLDRRWASSHQKDLYAMRLKARSGADLVRPARKAHLCSETARLEKLLQLSSNGNWHMAIVVR